jgi:acyl carrier protein
MKRSEFLTALIEAIEVESDVTETTALANIGEWDSLAAVTALALFNKKLGLKVTASDVKDCKTISDLLDLGNSKYE